LKDELILDPYGGSGSVAIAAHELGRRAIVIERDEVMWHKATERLKEVMNGKGD
jgi:DNA modification methylase